MSGKDDFKLLKWHGKDRLYQCRLCAFSTFDQSRFEDHFSRVHPPLRIVDGGKSKPEPTVATERVENKEANNGDASR